MGKKLKYQGGITKKICQKLAERNKNIFRKELPSLNISNLVKPGQVDFEIISFSGALGFEDQVLSIYSFLVYAGTPIKWVIYSDGSYTGEHKQIFAKQFPFVSVVEWDVYPFVKERKSLTEYLDFCHLAKKINIITGHTYTHQTIYLDSDIVFYENISAYLTSGLLSTGLWYAPDTMWGKTGTHFDTPRQSIYPLNSGLLILNEKFDRNDVFEYMDALKGQYHYFSEQSSFEYAFRKQQADILDPRQFIIDSSDQFDFSTKYNTDEIAMRHYTTPVRHKIWQRGWKWHLTRH